MGSGRLGVAGFPVFKTLPYADVEAYAAFMKGLLTPWLHQAWIAIIDPTQTTSTEDSVTGVITGVTITPVWTGYSRVQPLRSALGVKRAVDSTTTRVVQFQIEYPTEVKAFDIKPGFEIVVMDGLNDPFLEEYQYVVTGAINSSMAWQRTIETTVNLESRPQYDTSGWPQPPEA